MVKFSLLEIIVFLIPCFKISQNNDKSTQSGIHLEPNLTVCRGATSNFPQDSNLAFEMSVEPHCGNCGNLELEEKFG